MFGVSEQWRHLVEWTSDGITSPLLSRLHVSTATLSSHELATSLLIALIQIGVIAFVFRPLESLLPAESWTDRHLTRVDRNYTLLMVLGILPLTIFLAMTPLRVFLGDDGAGGDGRIGLHAIAFLDQHPYLLFLVYYLVFDFAYYWMHRVQHAIPWWWALHSLHHSQRQVSCWTNDRECFVGGLLEASVLASVGLVLGVDPSEFALLILVGELIQNFSHANVRVGFGKWLNVVFVGPAFHRLHHMRAEPDRPGLHNCNFAQAFPVWDILFGTALYGEQPRATGVTDPMVDADNERGLIGQQWTALRRFTGAIRRRAGWTPGEVSFGAGYVPIPEPLAASPDRLAFRGRAWRHGSKSG
jgi:sterol desaturase/sphingolipid hydroxylase (fatty acid hydroxylase superfamily)